MRGGREQDEEWREGRAGAAKVTAAAMAGDGAGGQV